MTPADDVTPAVDDGDLSGRTTFATATVAEIDGPAWDGTPGEFHYLVTVTDVEELS